MKDWAKVNNVELVYTPTYASRLNRIECHFGSLRKFALEGSDFAKHKDLGVALQAYLRWWNKNKRKAIYFTRIEQDQGYLKGH